MRALRRRRNGRNWRERSALEHERARIRAHAIVRSPIVTSPAPVRSAPALATLSRITVQSSRASSSLTSNMRTCSIQAALVFPAVGAELTVMRRSSVVLPAPFGCDDPDAIAFTRRKVVDEAPAAGSDGRVDETPGWSYRGARPRSQAATRPRGGRAGPPTRPLVSARMRAFCGWSVPLGPRGPSISLRRNSADSTRTRARRGRNAPPSARKISKAPTRRFASCTR